MVTNDLYTGSWRLTHWFPSNEHVGDDSSTHQMKVARDGDALVFESLPTNDGSYIMARLTIEDTIATGYWHETSAATGPYKGAQYSGYGQLVVDPTSGNMEGKWAGAGYDHKLQKMLIYSGNWEIVREVA